MERRPSSKISSLIVALKKRRSLAHRDDISIPTTVQPKIELYESLTSEIAEPISRGKKRGVYDSPMITERGVKRRLSKEGKIEQLGNPVLETPQTFEVAEVSSEKHKQKSKRKRRHGRSSKRKATRAKGKEIEKEKEIIAKYERQLAIVEEKHQTELEAERHLAEQRVTNAAIEEAHIADQLRKANKQAQKKIEKISQKLTKVKEERIELIETLNDANAMLASEKKLREREEKEKKERLQQEKDSHTHQLDILQEKITKLKIEKTEVTVEYEEIKHQLQDKQSQLSHQLQEHKHTLEALQISKKECEKSRSTLLKYEEEIELIGEELKSSEAYYIEQVQQLQDKLYKAQCLLDQTEKKEREREEDKMKEDCLDVISTSEREKELEERISDLMDLLEEKKGDVQELKDALKECQQELLENQDDYEALIVQYHEETELRSKREKEYSDIQNDLNQLTQLLNTLKTDLSVQRIAHDQQLSEIQQQLEESQDSRVAYAQEYHEKMEELASHAHHLQNDLDTASVRLHESQISFQEVSALLKDTQEQLEQAQNQVEEYQKCQNRMEESFYEERNVTSQLKEEVVILEDKVELVQGELEKTRKEGKEYEGVVTELQHKVDYLHNKVAQYAVEVTDLLKDIECLTHELTTNAEELRKAELREQDMRLSIEKAEERGLDNLNEQQHLHTKLISCTRERDNAVADLDITRAHLQNARDDLQASKIQLEEANNNAAFWKEKFEANSNCIKCGGWLLLKRRQNTNSTPYPQYKENLKQLEGTDVGGGAGDTPVPVSKLQRRTTLSKIPSSRHHQRHIQQIGKGSSMMATPLPFSKKTRDAQHRLSLARFSPQASNIVSPKKRQRNQKGSAAFLSKQKRFDWLTNKESPDPTRYHQTTPIMRRVALSPIQGK